MKLIYGRNVRVLYGETSWNIWGQVPVNRYTVLAEVAVTRVQTYHIKHKLQELHDF